MSFPDEQHIARILSALWNRAPAGRATVLVGAGFSGNAQPLRQGPSTMPGWTSLVGTMIDALYAGDKSTANWRRERAIKLSPATSEALRIAQEFEAEFGRIALDRLIADNVPDEAFGPGEMHRLLMELPWADVLTTNWDTLLERSSLDVENRVYSIVRVPEDIPNAPQPRIVKLHGTLPSHRPFIFTEDDFRTYPERFAPFLNLARQTTMENVLVLIGFSGDDPNFLFWSGWVRDRLGPYAPTIYLVGPLNLSTARRKMLERRGVQPIDLVHLETYDAWPEESQRGLAVRWFLERLASAEPYKRLKWPRPQASKLSRFKTLAVQEDPTAPLPFPSGMENWTPENVAQTILPALRHNREIYPGWVVAPRSARAQIWNFLQFAVSHAGEVLPKLTPVLRLSLAYEMNWLSETALLPVFTNLEVPVRCLLKTTDLKDLDSEQKSQAIALILALIRYDREEDNMGSAQQWDSLVEPHIVDQEHLSRLYYERCLRALNTLNYDQLDAELKAWPNTGTPFWWIRKAALLAENDRVDEAVSLSMAALSAIRLRTSKRSEDIASWSQEAYALLLRSSSGAARIADWEDRQIFIDRMRDLAKKGADSNDEREWIAIELSYPPPPNPSGVQKVRGFDVGQETRTQNWNSHSPIVYRRKALEAVRFLEEAAQPTRIHAAAAGAPILAGVARWLHDIDPTRSISALARTAGSEKTVIDIVFSREAVASLDTEFAMNWGARLLIGVEMLAKRLNDPNLARPAGARLALLVEMLSRLVTRLPSLAPAVLDFATTCLDKSLPSSLEKPFINLVKRAFSGLSDEMVPIYRRRLYETPIPITQNAYYKDPAEAAKPSRDSETPDPEMDGIIRETIGKLHDRERRYAAASRIQSLESAGMLTDAQTKAYADALWDPAFLENGLPGLTPLRPWVFALLPHPPGSAPAEIVKARLLALTDLDSDDAQGTISAIIANDPPPVCLTASELKPFLAMLLTRAQPQEPGPVGMLDALTDPVAEDHNFWGIFNGMLGLCAKHASLRRMIAKYYSATPAPASSISVAKVLNAKIIDLAAAEDLATSAWNDSGFAVVAAARGSFDWLKSAAAKYPFPQVIWEITCDNVIALSGNSVLASIDFLRSAYSECPQHVPLEIDSRLTRALFNLLKRTEVETRDNIVDFDSGFARRQGARLVTEMVKAGRAPEELAASWREAASKERIPEILLGFPET